MSMLIDNKFEIGDTVFLKTDAEQSARLVYAFKVYRNEIVYCLCAGTTISEHYEFEMTLDKSYINS